MRRGAENWRFSTNKSPYLRNGGDKAKITITRLLLITDRTRSRLLSKSTLDDLEWPYCTNAASFKARHGNLKKNHRRTLSGKNIAHGLYFQPI